MKYILLTLIALCACNTRLDGGLFISPEMGIVEVGEPYHGHYQGVIICGEAITLNATDDISDSHIKAMLRDALRKRKGLCKEL
jgi:hypothetical protein